MSRANVTATDTVYLAPANQNSPLQVLECRIYRGPHLYSHTPMIRIQIDLGDLENFPTHKLPGFTSELVRCLPGLSQHTCSTGRIGGFVSRLEEGTWLGHVIEHVAIELQSMAGIAVTRGKTRSIKGKPGQYNIMYSYMNEDAGLYAGRLALDLVASLIGAPFDKFKGCNKVYAESADVFDLANRLAALKEMADSKKLGPTTQSLVDEAERRNIPWRKLDKHSLVQLGTGRFQKLIRASVTSATSNIATETASDKDLTKTLLSEAGIPVPGGETVRTLDGALVTATEIGFPVVVKPLDGNHGRGVSTNLMTVEQVAIAFSKAKEHSNLVVIEKYIAGKDYRVLVVNGEVVAAAERIPAHVVGDGVKTIAELIDIVNADPRRGEGHEKVMTRIRKDAALNVWLAGFAFTLETVPESDQHVMLCPTGNLSTGATAIDCTDEIHPDNASIARRAALIIGLDVAGIDMVLPDIRKSWRENGGGIIEVNASPGFRMHLQPSEGRPRDIAKPVLAALFPHGTKTHVPVVAVTGTNGKSTTVRMVAHILRQSGLRVGFTSTCGIYVNDECIWEGDASGPKSARIILRDPTVDIAVLETARGGILREGLGVMDVDVGAVLNVTTDHLGIGGIDTIEDLAKVKSVVTESVHSRGFSILNADDPQTAAIAKYAGGKVCYFSMSSTKGTALREHLEKGGRAVTREFIGETAQIVLHDEYGSRKAIINVNDIPATHAGVAGFNVENALAATAIASSLDIAPEVIRAALSSFTSSYEQNPGRFNIYDGHGFRVIMDYAHNPAALRAFFSMIRKMRTHYLRVIGHVSTPGDRRNDDIREVGNIAGSELDHVVFREFPDNRGRSEGAICNLLTEGAMTAGSTPNRIKCVYTEAEATDICLQMAQPGDLVILTPSEIEDCWAQVMNFKPNFTKHPRTLPYSEDRKYAS